MVRVITQETYDEVVKENIDEFDMSPGEAIKEAVAQFEAQGVDLSNIIKDLTLGAGDDHKVSTVVKNLKMLCTYNSYDDESILKHLEELKTECNKDIAHRVRAGKDGAYKILIDLLEQRQNNYIDFAVSKDEKMIVSVLNTLISLMDVQPDLLDSRGVDLMKSLVDNTENEMILIPTLRWISVCCVKHEMNRQRIFGKNIADNLKMLVKVRTNTKIMSETMQVIRKLTLDDDIRVEFGKAHEHARELGARLLEPLTEYLKENPKPLEASETMLTMAALLVRNELCALVGEAGGDSVMFTILADNLEVYTVALQASKLITALAGNDDVKRKLMKAGIAPIVVSLLNRHSSNATAVASILKCISALCLREPPHGCAFFDCGAPEVVVQCLTMHSDNASVQRNGCWAIRNMVARCREQNPKYHELGVEAVLNAAYDKFGKDFGYDIKSALIDLECDVKLVEQWTGKGVEIEK